MKRVINLLFVLVLLSFAFPALAQEESSLSEIALKKTYRENWYLSIGPSANILFAEQDAAVSAFKRLKFGGELSVGKWFNQNTGMSLNILGGGLRGFNYTMWTSGGYYTPDHINYPMGGNPMDSGNKKKYAITKDKNGKEGFWQDFNFLTSTVDVMGNVTNLFRGRAAKNSCFDLIAFAGLGVNLAFDNKVTTPNFWMATFRTGLRANFNLTNNIAIYLEPAVYATDPEFDGYKGTAVGDAYTTFSLGVQYTFNKDIFSPFEKKTIDELDHLNRRINENRDLIENHQDILERQQKLLDKLGSSLSGDHTKYVPVVQKEISKVLPEYIRFALDSYTIDKSEYTKISEVVDFLKNNPDAKLLLVGYADRKTGNPTYNFKLSKKRVEVVQAELKRLGVKENRLYIEWKGDKEQPFTTNEWNRVVIMVERK